MKEQIYSGLEFVCQRSNNALVSKFLKIDPASDSYVDVLYKSGLYFNIAIAHDNPSLVKMLLDHMYTTKQIEPDPKNNNTDQSIKCAQLQKILKEAKKEHTISEEVNSILANFCKEDDINGKETDEEDNFNDDDSYIDDNTLSTHDQELVSTGVTKVLEDHEF